jgi:hypothetical protein
VPAAVALSDDDGAADTATLSQAEPVLTETMAELYLKQGHQEDALRVYQALLSQRPGDARLRAKIEHLASGGRRKAASGVSAQAFLKGILAGRGGAPPPSSPAPSEPPPEAPSTLDAAFESAAPPLGEPTHPADNNISLDTVFGSGGGDGGAGGGGGGGGGAEAATGGGDATGGFSFDDFFGGAGRPPESGAPAARRASGTGRAQRPVEDEAELDHFQQWLKKLKS